MESHNQEIFTMEAGDTLQAGHYGFASCLWWFPMAVCAQITVLVVPHNILNVLGVGYEAT